MENKMKSMGFVGIKLALVLFGIFACLTLLTQTAYAGKVATAEATVTFTGPSPTLLPAGDDEGHVVGLGKRSGKAVFGDGQNAAYSNVFFMDWYRGKKMSIWGYTKIAFKDGSWFFFKWDSQFAGLDKAGKPMFKGTGEILKGAGRYLGITGSVTYKNRRLPPSEEYPKGATEAKAVFKYTLP